MQNPGIRIWVSRHGDPVAVMGNLAVEHRAVSLLAVCPWH